MRTLVETGALAGERGAYRLARPLPAIQVPATVQAVLAARIDRLPAGRQALLQTASVVGKDVPVRAARRRSPSCPRSELRARDRPPPGRGVPVRGRPLPGPRVHVQARADPRRGLRQPAPGPAARPPRARSWRPSSGSIPTGWPSTSSGWPTTPSAASRGRRRSPTSGRPEPKAVGRSAHREAVACFEQALAALAASPGDPRDAGAGDRCSARPSELRSSCWVKLEQDGELSSGGRSPGRGRSVISVGWAGSRPHGSHLLCVIGVHATERGDGRPERSRRSPRRSAMMPSRSQPVYLVLACLPSPGDYPGAEASVGDIRVAPG